MTVAFHQVHQRDNPLTDADESLIVDANVTYSSASGPNDVPYETHPFAGVHGWLWYDLAFVHLAVSPNADHIIPFKTIDAVGTPALGNEEWISGYGSAVDPCGAPGTTLHTAATPLDTIVNHDDGSSKLTVLDPTIHACGGDSGGPMVDSHGNIVGVGSSIGEINGAIRN